ncbi:PREDICTED: protein TIFY 4B-like isoform X3 [Erythranthe guttata]|nr:PREDICTED: protein TIFY 4B-like isoform X3 [Erythranthe guttata]|eukprot:XP_012839507.1 PREDICTED: protein TIFY 4B-like isoform X3 [Erythranthe guttata]
MQPEVTAVNSSLEKPLHQLTEDDIAQVTREDCRRYLKEKGMRRPSWNKSQAIQQVIMLKTLLEGAPDSDSGSRKRLRFSRPNDNGVIPESVPKATHIEGETSVSAEYTAPFCGKDLDKPDSSRAAARCLAVNNDPTLSRTTASLGMPVGQMTIFYCGKVNVYDDVPEDKAQSIMHIAASPVQFPQEQPVDDTIINHPLTSLSKAVSVKAGLDSPVALLPALQTVKMSDNSRALADECISLREGTPAVEGPSTRKASVQRYLDKRKDR